MILYLLRDCEAKIYKQSSNYYLRPMGGKYGEDIYVCTNVDDCLICCKSTTTMSKFKQKLLTRFQGTDEGEVKEYLGCEVIRDKEQPGRAKWYKQDMLRVYCVLLECGIAILCLLLWIPMYV